MKKLVGIVAIATTLVIAISGVALAGLSWSH